MVKAKRIATSFAAVAMLICTLVSMCLPVSAATSSRGIETQTITVVTKANYLCPGSESITLSQTKGTCSETTYNIFTRKSKTKTSKVYGEWDIVAEASDGSHTIKKSLTGNSVKINLKPNKTYKITVTWDSTAASFTILDKGNFTSYPTWKVKSTWKVSNYY